MDKQDGDHTFTSVIHCNTYCLLNLYFEIVHLNATDQETQNLDMSIEIKLFSFTEGGATVKFVASISRAMFENYNRLCSVDKSINEQVTTSLSYSWFHNTPFSLCEVLGPEGIRVLFSVKFEVISSTFEVSSIARWMLSSVDGHRVSFLWEDSQITAQNRNCPASVLTGFQLSQLNGFYFTSTCKFSYILLGSILA